MTMDMDDKDYARLLGLARVVLGTGFLLMPGRSLRMAWGIDADPAVAAVMRGMGGRDLALGVGLLASLDDGGRARGWLEAGALADASDALGTVLAWSSLPRWRRLLIVGSAAGAAWLGLQLAGELDD
jgi:hypothetical protein